MTQNLTPLVKMIDREQPQTSAESVFIRSPVVAAYLAPIASVMVAKSLLDVLDERSAAEPQPRH